MQPPEGGKWRVSSMSRISGWWVALFFVCAVPLVGCGTSSGEKGGGIGAPTAAIANTDADISSGCWSAADRGASEGERTGSNVTFQQWSKPPEMAIDVNKTYRATLDTSGGTIEIELFPKESPITVNNFVCLARAGYYDGTPFHRIVQGFVIQGGDPTGTGSGGPGYRIQDEPISPNRNYTKGVVAMARTQQPNSGGSQFFICTGDLTGKLGKSYMIFGQVTSGMDVVDALDKTPTKSSSGGEKSSPIDPVTLNKVTITEA